MSDPRLEIILAAKDASAQAFGAVNKRIQELTGGLGSLKGMVGTIVAGYGFKEIAGHALAAAAGFEQMRAKLDVVTKGQGAYAFDNLRRWTADMPVMLSDVTNSFVTMQAMGLEPTEARIRTLTDVASVMGQDVFGRVVLQLGQMSSKGKVMAQDLNILAEAGINARKYITEAFGMTVDEIEKSGIGINQVVREIFKGMERDFDGASQKMMSNWEGIRVTAMKSIEQIETGIMGAGISDALKQMATDATAAMNAWYKENEYFIKQNLPGYIKSIDEALRGIAGTASYVVGEIGVGTIEAGILGRILFGSWRPAALLAAVDAVDRKIKEMAESAGIRQRHESIWGWTKESVETLVYGLRDAANLTYQIFVKDPADFIRTLPEIQAGYRSFWTGRLTAAGNARLDAYPSEAAKARGYTGAPVYYDYGRSNINITADEARDSADRQRKADADAKDEKRIAANRKFWEDYKKEIEGAFEFERFKLDEQLKEYEKYVQDKAALARWYQAEKRKIDIKEFSETAGTQFPSISYGVEAARARAWKANQEALEAYGKSVEEQRQAIAKADEAANQARWWETYVEGTEDAVRANEIFKDSMDIMSQSAADAFAEFVTGTKSAKGAFTAMAQSMVAAMVRIQSQKAFEGLFGMIATGVGSLFSGSTPTGMGTNTTFSDGGSFGSFMGLVKHAGGMGNEPGPTARIPAWMVAHAPSFHTGVGPDEVVAKIRKDEGVFTPGQMRALGLKAQQGAGGIQVVVNNNAPGVQVAPREEIDPSGLRRLIVDIVAADIAGGGDVLRAHQHATGVRRRGRY